MSWKEYLESAYFDLNSPISYAGPLKIYRYFKNEGKYIVGIKAIRQWLQNVDAYSLQRPVRYKFKTRRVISQGVDFLWDIDLADVSNLAQENSGTRFLLVAIDVFSRYLWTVPLQNKKHDSIIEGLKEVFESGRKPKEIRTDPGSEWKNRWVKSFLNKQDIDHYVTRNPTHANYAERVIRTLKVLMHRYFTHERTYHYLDILQNIVSNYNARSHSSLDGKAPEDISEKNQSRMWKKLYIDTIKKTSVKDRKKRVSKPFRFKLNDFVRLSKNRRVFQRDYDEKWTEEIFVISARYLRQGIPVYKVIDYDGDPIEGSFYSSELQKVDKSRDDLFKVEKVLKRRKRNGIKEVYIKWLGYPKKFNRWLPESDLKDL